MKKYIKITLSLIFTCLLILTSHTFAATTFNVNRKSLKLYDTFDLKELVTTTSQNLTFTSSNSTVAQVSSDGILFANSFGQAFVTVSDGTSSAQIEIACGYANGFDISTHNGTVDWNKVKKEGMDFVMIRSSYGCYTDADKAAGKAYTYQFDKQLANNLKGAVDAGIPFGVYHYSYADTLEEAELEADYVISALNTYYPQYSSKMTLPVAYDVENANQQAVGKKQTTEQIIAFTNKLNAAGYEVIVYANNNFFVNYIDTPKLYNLGYKFWYARYFYTTDLNKIRTIGDYGYVPYIYQYTETGAVNGATTSGGATDMNVMYYPTRCKVTVTDENATTVKVYGVDVGEKLGSLENLEKTGYNFVGYKDKNGNAVDENTIVNAQTLTISPVFEKKNVESIAYDIESKEIEYDEVTTAKIPNVITLPEDAIVSREDIEYSLDNDSVVTLNKEDLTYTIIGEGTVKIKCYLKENPSVYDEYVVTYTKPGISTIEFAEKERNYSRPTKDTLPEITVIPEDFDFDLSQVRFELDREDVISLNDDLSYEIIGEGKVTVKCILIENNDIFASMSINVEYIYDKGDINHDFKINSTDSVLALEIYAKGTFTEEELKYADMNNDGKVNSTDASLILEEFKAGE